MERELRNKLHKGRFEGTSLQRSETMRAIRSQGNRATELRLRLGMARARISGWRLQPKTVLGKPDFWFAERKFAIFVDGCFWHGCPTCGRTPKTNSAYWQAKFERNSIRDNFVTHNLKSSGIEVIRFWEHELRDNLQECISTILEILEKTPPQADESGIKQVSTRA